MGKIDPDFKTMAVRVIILFSLALYFDFVWVPAQIKVFGYLIPYIGNPAWIVELIGFFLIFRYFYKKRNYAIIKTAYLLLFIGAGIELIFHFDQFYVPFFFLITPVVARKSLALTNGFFVIKKWRIRNKP